MITSATSSSQIYSINQVTKTRATSSYTEVTPTSPISRMEQMQEKYKDVYSPMPMSYSKEREELQLEKIREVYPDAMSDSEGMQWIKENLISFKFGETLSQEDKEINKANSDKLMKSLGGIVRFNDIVEFTREMRAKYPTNRWAGTSNSKELANFYNAAVYEGLEQGIDLRSAGGRAVMAMSYHIDTSEYENNKFKTMKSLYDGRYDLTEEEKELVKQTNYQKSLSYDINLTKYGFHQQWNKFEKPEPNDKIMVSRIENKIELFDFMLKNPDIIEEEFQKSEAIVAMKKSDRPIPTAEQWILQRVIEYMPREELALNVYEKYKIFDSVDIKA